MARKPRRRSFWLGRSFDYLALTTGTQVIEIISEPNLHLVSEEPTIIRMVGRLAFQFERAAGDFNESMRSAAWLGISCLHEDLTGQSPKDDLSEEHWMWCSYLQTQATFIEAPTREFDSNTVISGATASRASQHVPNALESVEFDIRSMRKVPEPCNLEFSLTVEEQMATTGALHKLSGFIRVLLKQ